MKNSVFKGASWVYIEQIINVILSFIVSVLIVRSLKTSDYGLWKLLATILTIITYTISLGLETTLSRYIPAFNAKKEYLNINKLLYITVIVRITILIIISLSLYFFEDFFDSGFNTGVLFERLFWYSILYIGIYHINTLIGRSFLTGYANRHIVSYIKIISKILYTLGIVYVYFFSSSLESILLIVVLNNIFELVFFLFFLIPKIRLNYKLERESKNDSELPSEELFQFSLNNFLFLSGQVFREYNVDNIVIAYYLDPTAVAIYGIAIMFPTYIRNFAPGRMLSGVLLPYLVDHYEKTKEHHIVEKYFQIIQKINYLILWPLTIVLLIFTGEIIKTIYGLEYSYSVTPARILLFFVFIQVAVEPFYLISNSIGRSNLVLYSSIWGFINLFGNILLIPVLGINGAAISTGLTSVFIYFYFYISYRIKYKINFKLKVLWFLNAGLNLFPSIAILLVIKQYELYNFIGVVLSIIAILSFYLMNRRNKIFNSDEKEIIIKQMPFIKSYKILTDLI